MAAAALALTLAGCNEIAAQHAAPIRPVLVAAVHYEAQARDRSFVGTVRPRIESDLGFRVGGKVLKRLVEVGALVNAGTPLATLDEVDLKLQAEQAEAELRAASGVLAQASAAEGRTKELRQKGWSTDAQLDQAKAAGDEARARLNRAERQVELTKNSLSYATLAADAPGVVTATLIEPGQVVSAGQTAFRVARLAEKEVVVAVPETLLARAKSGEARVSIWSVPDKLYVAKLRELAPSADPATRTYLAKFSIPGVGDEVQLGMTAMLILSEPASERVARLPLSALFDQGAGPAMYVADAASGAITLKPVSVKAYESNDVLISGGVDEGAKVVTLGVQKLNPAEKVKVVSSLSFYFWWRMIFSGKTALHCIPEVDVCERESAMSRFNVSAWAVAHPALVLFLIVMLGTAGLFSYRSLGRGEDPSFTIKLVVVTAMWPGATAAEMQTQVADPIEKKMQELPFIDKVTTYSKSGFTAMQVAFKDNTPARDVPQLFYQLRKKLSDIKDDLPSGLDRTVGQ